MANPIIRHTYTCDPTVLVHQDTVYLYTGHDEAPVGTEAYVLHHWQCFSSRDLVRWQQHPLPLRATDFSWARGDAYASKVLEHRGKFYWFVSVSPAQSRGKALGVAVADTPAGPFSDALGQPLVTHEMLPATDNDKANLDPTVLVDAAGQAHLYWGNGTCYYARLRDDLLGLDSPIHVVALPDFSEGAHLHQRNGWYYLAYGYQMPEKVAYAMSRHPAGPWTFQGLLSELAGNCQTNRAAIFDFRGRSYFAYHNGGLPEGGSHRRSVCLEDLQYEADETLRRVVMTSEGVTSVAC